MSFFRGPPRWLPIAVVALCVTAQAAPLHLPNEDLQADGEAIFCAHARFGREKSCQQQWRYAMALTCGPKCHAAEAKLQTDQALHFAAVAREGCDQKASASCLTSCLVGDLLSERFQEVGTMNTDGEEDQGLGRALEGTISKTQKGGDRWFFSNVTDPLTLVMNATLSDPAAARARKERLDEFWGDLCGKLHEQKSPHRKRLCPSEGGGGVEVNFDYLDDLKAAEESERRVNDVLYGDHATQQSQSLLQLSPEDYLAEVAKHTPKRVAMKALKKASGRAGQVELLKVKKFMEVSFLREKKRVFECSHPAILRKMLAGAPHS